MFEQDYIMRLIKEIVRMIVKILFNIDTEKPTEELLNEAEKRKELDKLLALVENGNINEAENILYEMSSDRSMEDLKLALIFYSYLNDKSDDFLEKNNFSREEIEDGLKDIISIYGLGNLTDMFLAEL